MMNNTATPIEDFFIPRQYLAWAEVIGKAAKIEKIVDRHDGGSSILTSASEQELDELLNSAERICQCVRQAKANRYIAIRPAEKGSTMPVQDGSPVEVSFENGTLRIKTPPTLMRQKEQSWYLANCVKAALETYVAEHGSIDIPLPCHVTVCRTGVTSAGGYRDNENFESSRIINAVMQFLGYNDQPERLVYTSMFKVVNNPEESDVEFTFRRAEGSINCGDQR